MLHFPGSLLQGEVGFLVLFFPRSFLTKSTFCLYGIKDLFLITSGQIFWRGDCGITLSAFHLVRSPKYFLKVPLSV